MKFSTTLIALVLASVAFSQNYVPSNSTGTSSPYAYNNSGTTVLALPASDVLSTWQTLPFTFEFYGQTVSGYYASDNGYITFDNTATISDPTNTSLPNVAGPNNAIYAFWDDLDIIAGGGSTDEIRSFDYGTAPNRTHVIQWYSVTAGSGFLYTAIRIHECGDFDIIENYGSSTGMTATIGCEDATGANGTQIAGSPNIDFPSVGSGDADDIVYTFHWDQNMYDLSIASTNFSQFVTVGSNNITGDIANFGSQVVTSFDLHYTIDGGTTQTDNITGVSIPGSGGVYSFSHGIPWIVSVGGANHDLCIWADNINNGNNDERTCNDQICQNLFTNTGTSGTRTVLVEEFTGAWCGWCVDGAVVLEDILANNGSDVVGVSVHDGDAMEFSDGIRTAFGVSAYPNGQVDRKVFPGEVDEPHSRGSWSANTTSQIGSYTPADVSVSHTYNSITRVIDMTVTADFADYAAGDLRFVAMIVEDSVVGTGTGYDQVNYTNGTAGHPYEGAGDPILGFVHNHVLRALPAGAFGNAGVIPSPSLPASTVSENFTYTLPASYNENHVKVIGFVSYYSTTIGEREVVDVAEVKLGSAVGLSDIPQLKNINLFPNPAQNNLNIELSVLEKTNASVFVFDVYGRRVLDLGKTEMMSGNQLLNYNISDLSNGAYFVSIVTESNKTYTRKLTIAK